MKTLFANGFVWDGVVDRRIAADVLVESERIVAIGTLPPDMADNARRIDASGATLIPGLVDAHGHLSFPIVAYACQIEDTSPEETVAISSAGTPLAMPIVDGRARRPGVTNEHGNA